MATAQSKATRKYEAKAGWMSKRMMEEFIKESE